MMRAIALAVLIRFIPLARAQSSSGVTVPVRIDNFARAQSDLYMSNSVKEGGIGKLFH